MLDIIKSYLVALGFTVNQQEFQRAQGAINDLGRTVQTATSGMARNFAVAATGVTAALATINAATAGLMTQVAAADMQYQKFALRLWTTKENAKALKTTLDAMGENMEDVAWIPELRREFMQLRRQGSLMQTPADAGGQLQYVRSIMFEFKRLKLEVQYASEWISYYLIKYLGGPLASVKKQFSEMNDRLTVTMPGWTKKIAEVLTVFMNIGIAAVRFIRDMYNGFTHFFDLFPPGVKKAVTAIAVIGAAFKLSPIGAIITTLLLLIEDFYGYIDGRKSSKMLAPIWVKLISVWEKLINYTESAGDSLRKYWQAFKESAFAKSLLEVFISLWETLKAILDVLIDMLGSLFDAFADLFGFLLDSGALEAVVDLFSTLFLTVSSLVRGVANLTKEVWKFWKDAAGTQAARTMWDWFKGTLGSVLKLVSSLGKSFLGLFDMIGLGLQGKFGEAAERGKKILQDIQGGDFESFVNAISNQESGGDYTARNARTGAYGRFQIMPENWPSWSAEAGLPPGSPMTPENQDLVARFKLRQYYNKYGARGAAIAWYAGEGALSYSDAALNRRQGRGDEPSINEYADSILGRMPARGVSPVAYHGGLQVADMFNAMSYRPRPVAGAGGQTNSTTITVGNIYITQPSATPAQIQQAVAAGVQQASQNTSRQVRELSPVVI